MEEVAVDRESMQYDVVIVGAGPAGLSAAYRLKNKKPDLSVCIVEKGSEVGAHILSGAVFETKALDELIPEWRDRRAPVTVPVTEDHLFYFTGAKNSVKIPGFAAPKTMHNSGNYIISLGNLCRWLAEQCEDIGVEIFPGFAAADIALNEKGDVTGIITGDMGLDKDGHQKDSYMAGMELNGKFTLFAEGARGHLGKQLINQFSLDKDKDPQHFGLGIKELWTVPETQHKQGLVVHSAGWPLSASGSLGGGFLYHLDNNQVVVGLVSDLSYSNPHLSPFDEFQRYKHHPQISKYLESGDRIAYGARVINKGGLQSQPKLSFPGGMLIGDDAGTLNFAKIKGTHTAMKSGIVAADAVIEHLSSQAPNIEFTPTKCENYERDYKKSWAYKELHAQRNFGPAQHKWGNFWGSAYAFVDINVFNGTLPWTLNDTVPDHATLDHAQHAKKIAYPAPDGILSFDKLSSVYLSNTNHEENQPCHLQLKQSRIPIDKNLPEYDEPAQRYCPAGVYEIVESGDQKHFQINAQNCVHCKTCDIKDPAQNITWCVPEGTGGPNYPNM